MLLRWRGSRGGVVELHHTIPTRHNIKHKGWGAGQYHCFGVGRGEEGWERKGGARIDGGGGEISRVTIWN